MINFVEVHDQSSWTKLSLIEFVLHFDMGFPSVIIDKWRGSRAWSLMWVVTCVISFDTVE